MVDFRCVYGHAHNTTCDYSAEGEAGCAFAMVGGGGGCCAPSATYKPDVTAGGAGFGAPTAPKYESSFRYAQSA